MPIRISQTTTLIAFCLIGCILPNLIGCRVTMPQSMPSNISLPQETIIPMDITQGVPIVQVNINGQGPFRMIIDTSSRGMMFSTNFAKKHNLPPSPYQSYNEKHGYRWIDELQIGQAKLQGFDAAAWFDIPEIVDAYFDGYLGKNLFLNLLLTIDYPNSRIILRPYKPLNPDDPNVVSTRAVYSQLLAIPIQIDGSTYPFFIDTSDPDAFSIRSDLRNALRFKPTPPYTSLTTNKRRIDHTLKLAQHTIEKPIVTPAPNAPSPPGRYPLPDPIDNSRSSVGHDLLKHFTLTFDLKSNLVRFERELDTPIITPPLRVYVIGRDMTRIGDNVVVGQAYDLENTGAISIAHLLPPLETGDLIAAFNGMPIEEFNSQNLDKILNTQSQITLTVQRGAQTLTMTAPIITLLP